MSTNPYAHPEGYEPEHHEPQRVSVLAISSLVLSLVCCIPGVSLLGAVLGVFAMVRISQARGRVYGRGMAVAGLVIGLLFTLVWVALGVGFAMFMRDLDVYGDTMRALDQRDYNRVRELLTPAAAASATDARLEEYRAEVYAEWGAYRTLPGGAFDWLRAYAQQMQNIAQEQQQQMQLPGEMLPLPAYYERGLALVILRIDSRSVSPLGAAQAANIAVLDQQDSPMWLVPAAPPAAAPTPAPPPQTPEAPPPDDPQPGVDPGSP
jgi:hypothetical protein